MNKVILIGRLTKDPELRYTPNNVAVCQFTLAVDRRFTSKSEGQPTADFIPCVAWRQSAEFLSKYFTKGTKAVVSGSIQVRTYNDKDNVKRYVTEVVVDDIEFGESKRTSSSSFDDIPAPSEPMGSQGSANRGEFFELDEGDSGLPF